MRKWFDTGKPLNGMTGSIQVSWVQKFKKRLLGTAGILDKNPLHSVASSLVWMLTEIDWQLQVSFPTHAKLIFTLQKLSKRKAAIVRNHTSHNTWHWTSKDMYISNGHGSWDVCLSIAGRSGTRGCNHDNPSFPETNWEPTPTTALLH